MTPGGVAGVVLERVQELPPRLGRTRLLCLDGPAGSGKSTLAGEVAALAARRGSAVAVLHTDDLYEGWSGLGDLAERLAHDVVGPLAQDRPGRYRRWDWEASRWAEEHAVEPVDLLVLEGVGAGTPRLASWRSLLVWVEAPHEVRLRRGLERDGDAFAPHWEAWARDEQVVFARDRTREEADLLVDGTGARAPEARWRERRRA